MGVMIPEGGHLINQEPITFNQEQIHRRVETSYTGGGKQQLGQATTLRAGSNNSCRQPHSECEVAFQVGKHSQSGKRQFM